MTLEEAAKNYTIDIPTYSAFKLGALWMKDNLTSPVSEDIIINSDNYTVTFHGKRISLPKKEFEVLRYLHKHAGRIISKDELLEQLWSDVCVGDRTIDVHIRKLRAKINIVPIKCVVKMGYMWDK
jgi:two-component system alkaline phosphatase synthesis response regulator PhoP